MCLDIDLSFLLETSIKIYQDASVEGIQFGKKTIIAGNTWV